MMAPGRPGARWPERLTFGRPTLTLVDAQADVPLRIPYSRQASRPRP